MSQGSHNQVWWYFENKSNEIKRMVLILQTLFMLKKKLFSVWMAHDCSVAGSHFLVQGEDVAVLSELSFILSVTEIFDFWNTKEPCKGLNLP